MIKLAGSLPCAGVAVETDPWIPLKVTWLPRQSGQPLYLRVSGSQGGEIEMKVDAVSGMLIQMIVLEVPPSVTVVTDSETSFLPESLAPVLDLGLWREDTEGRSASADINDHLKYVTEDMKCWRDSDRMGIVFSTLEKKVVYSCGVAQVGVSDDGNLVEVNSALRED